MADDNRGLVAAGAGLVWRRRSVLWWIFAVNIVLGALGTLPAARQLNRALRHTLAGEQLFKGFDLGMFYELQRLPEVNLLRFKPVPTHSRPYSLCSCCSSAAESWKLIARAAGSAPATSSPLRARSSGALCGSCFSRSCPSLCIRDAYFEVEKASDYLGDKVVADQAGFVIWLVGVLILVLIALFVRLWFDLAKVHAVATDERRMFRSAWKGLDVTRRQMRTLLWMYLRISLVAWIIPLVAFLIWTKIPPTAVWATFVLLELVDAGAAGNAIVADGEHYDLVSAACRAVPVSPISRRRCRRKCPSRHRN